jgi:hypothetical protein
MTELQTLERKIAQLPDEFKMKLEGYIDALLAEAWVLENSKNNEASNEINGPLDELKACSY